MMPRPALPDPMPADWWPDRIEIKGSVNAGPTGKLEVGTIIIADNKPWQAAAFDEIRASLWLSKEMWRLGLVKET